MTGVELSRPEQTRIEDLPVYLVEPRPVERFDRRPLAGACSRAYRSATARSQRPGHRAASAAGRSPGTVGPRHGDHSPVFDLMVPLGRRRVEAVLDAWWPGGAETAIVTVQRRLQLWPPTGDVCRGWQMQGRVRRLTSLHWVPVVVELWGKYDGFMRITVTPQSRVLTSRRYFRLGHSIIGRLWEELASSPVEAEALSRQPVVQRAIAE